MIYKYKYTINAAVIQWMRSIGGWQLSDNLSIVPLEVSYKASTIFRRANTNQWSYTSATNRAFVTCDWSNKNGWLWKNCVLQHFNIERSFEKSDLSRISHYYPYIPKLIRGTSSKSFSAKLLVVCHILLFVRKMHRWAIVTCNII